MGGWKTVEARRDYARRYAEKNRNTEGWRASNRNKQRRRRHKLKQELVQLMGGRCKRCGFNEHMFALEFDHNDPTSKETDNRKHSPSDLISCGNRQETIDYITKNCTMYCANCHSLKTVAYADNLRGTNLSDTSAEKELFESPSSVK